MFPDQESWAQQIEAAGFKGVEYENLTGGIVAIHSGFKLPRADAGVSRAAPSGVPPATPAPLTTAP